MKIYQMIYLESLLKMYTKNKCLFFIFYIFIGCTQTNNPSQIDFEYILDGKNIFSASDIFEKKLEKTNGKIPSFGYVSSSLWASIIIDGEVGQKKIAEINHSSLDRLDVFEVLNTNFHSVRKVGSWGDIFPFEKRLMPYRNINFYVESGKKYFMKATSSASLKLPIRIWDNEQFFRYATNEYSIFCLFYGILIAFFFVNLILGVKTRSYSYLIYCLFISSFFLLNFSVDGLFFQYVIPNLPEVKKSASLMFFLLFGITFVFYACDFLLRFSLDRKRLIYVFSSISLILWCYFLFLSIYDNYTSALNFGFLSICISSFLYSLIAISSWKTNINDINGKKYFFSALFLQTIGIFLYILKSKSFIPINIYSSHPTKILFIIEFFLLSMSISEYLTVITKKAGKYDIVSISFGKLIHESKKLFSSIKDLKLNIQDTAVYEKVKNKSNAVEYLMDEFSSISKNNLLRNKITLENFSLHEVFDEILTDLKFNSDKTKINSKFVHVYKAKGNYYLILSVFRNLLENAIEATSGNTEITICSTQCDNFIKISIKNTNSAIQMKYKLFKPFFSSKEKGSGLGLHICKSIIDGHGGAISCNSNKKVPFTEFTFTIPSSSEDEIHLFKNKTTINAIFIDDEFDEVSRYIEYENATRPYVKIIPLGVFSDPDIAVDFIEKKSAVVDVIYIDRFINGRDALRDHLPKIFRDSGFKNKIVLLTNCPPDDFFGRGYDQVIDKSNRGDVNENT